MQNMRSIKFHTVEEEQAAAQRIFDQASQEGLFVSGTTAYAIPEKEEFWIIPVVEGFERFFTKDEIIFSDLIEDGIYQIKPSQGKIQLHRMGIFQIVSQIIENSNDIELQIFWEYAITWELKNKHIIQLGEELGMSEMDVKEFFINASKIS
jgi:hypothetical protein